jgi:hypothetical protein
MKRALLTTALIPVSAWCLWAAFVLFMEIAQSLP